MEVHTTADGDDSTTDCATECVSQTELAAVKAEMESKFDKLHSQLLYWQNVTVNTVNDHCSSLGSNPEVNCIQLIFYQFFVSKVRLVKVPARWLEKQSWYRLFSISLTAVS